MSDQISTFNRASFDRWNHADWRLHSAGWRKGAQGALRPVPESRRIRLASRSSMMMPAGTKAALWGLLSAAFGAGPPSPQAPLASAARALALVSVFGAGPTGVQKAPLPATSTMRP